MTKQEYKKDKVACTECYWQGVMAQTLNAQNPFDLKERIIGCPQCKSIDSLCTICYAHNCWKTTTCGVPIENNYLWLCSDHNKELELKPGCLDNL